MGPNNNDLPPSLDLCLQLTQMGGGGDWMQMHVSWDDLECAGLQSSLLRAKAFK